MIFDPDGEYFWPDHHGRPGLCDVPELRDRLVVFTNRRAPSDAYASFVVDGVKLDIRQLPAARVLGLALGSEKQEQQNVVKLKGLSPDKWRILVGDDAVALDERVRAAGLVPVVTDLIMSDPEATAAFIAYAVKSGTA